MIPIEAPIIAEFNLEHMFTPTVRRPFNYKMAKFKTLIKYVGLINNQSVDVNIPPTHFHPTPTGDENFLARSCTFTNIL